MRLIDADALDMYECLRSYYGDAWRDAQKAIDDAPTVDPTKHGRWIETDCGDCCYECSECGFLRDAYILDVSNYRPHCGAKMDEVEDGRR